MKKNFYIAPSVNVEELELCNMIANSIDPDGPNPFSGAEEGGDGEGGDVKRQFNVWDDDWSK